jgi:hypothetical protein
MAVRPLLDLPAPKMKRTICISLMVCVFACAAATAFADETEKLSKPEHKTDSNPAVAIVRSAAKGTWAITKFSAGHIAKPVAKKVLLHAAPSATKFILKTAAKNALPLVAKLSVL